MWLSSHDRRQQKVSGKAGWELRKLLDQARDGGHTAVTKHGDESAVIVPYDWLRSALPELFNDEALPLNR
jgi:prevent-host-death family protein